MEKDFEENLNLILNFQNWIESYQRKIKRIAMEMNLDDVKLMMIRKKGEKLYKNLGSDAEKALFLKRLQDAMVFLKALSQGATGARFIEMEESSEKRREEIRNSDNLYRPKRKSDPLAKGLEGKCGRLGIDLSKLMDDIRNS